MERLTTIFGAIALVLTVLLAVGTGTCSAYALFGTIASNKREFAPVVIGVSLVGCVIAVICAKAAWERWSWLIQRLRKRQP